jgi:glycosyltransferase involved in cell wall biosynthesis
MNRKPPHILVVGTGSAGGIGRFERLLMAALHELSERGVLQVDAIWRRRHPAYLSTTTGTPQSGNVTEAGMSIFLAQMARSLLRVRPDLVLFLHVNLARAALVARVLGSRRYAVSTYGVEVWSPLDPLRRRALLAASGVLTISEYTAGQLTTQQGLPRSQVQVVPLALEPHWLEAVVATPPNEAASYTPGYQPRLVSVSRLDPTARDKGIDHVIRALPAVRAAVPDVRYHVVGDGQDRAYLEQVANTSDVADAVVFRGLVSQDELVEEYRSANIFILPSEREGFGLVFLEAMAYAKPVVARRAAAAVEVVADGDTGILVNDEHGLAAAMIALLSDPDRARAMGRAGLDRLRQVYSFETFTSRIEAALLAAVG